MNMNDKLSQFNQSLAWRYATKQFDPSKKISEEVFNQVLEAARLAPSSLGLQPWKFVVVEDRKLRQQLREHAWNQSQITDASHLVILCSRTEMTTDYVNAYAERIAAERKLKSEDVEQYRQMMLGYVGQLNGESSKIWMTNQVYLALGVLLSACALAGLDACPMEGFDAAKFDDILTLPQQGFNARVLCAVGYRSESDWLSGLKKVRFQASEVITRV